MSSSILPRAECELPDGRVATFRELGVDDYERVMALRNDIIANLADPDHYVREDDERSFVMSHLGQAGISLGMELDGELIGYSALTMDMERAVHEPELARAVRDSAHAARQSLDQYVLLAVTMIKPAFRRGPLHPAAIAGRLRIALERAKQGAMAMVPITNVASLRNLTRWRLSVVGLVEFPDGRVRFLLSGPVQPGEPEWDGPAQFVSLPDTAAHRRLTADGFSGHQVLVDQGNTLLLYSKSLKAR